MKKFIKRIDEKWYHEHEFEYCQQCGEIHDTNYYWYKDKKGVNKLYYASCLAEKLTEDEIVYDNVKTNW